MSKRDYFKKGTAYYKNPSLKGARYCRCVLHVADKQPRWCLRHKAWRNKVRDKKKCYNPYAVCTARLKRKGVMHCGDAYNVSGFPKSEQKTYALLKTPKVKKEIKVKEERTQKAKSRVPKVKKEHTRKQLLERAKKARRQQPAKFKGYYRWRKAELCKALNVKC